MSACGEPRRSPSGRPQEPRAYLTQDSGGTPQTRWQRAGVAGAPVTSYVRRLRVLWDAQQAL